jgi:hypothetical protein
MRAAKAAPDGSLTYLDGPNTDFFIRHNTLFELIDAIDSVKHWRTPTKTTFPWYQSCFGYDRPGGPSVADCFRPRDVLESLQGIERELQRNSKKYPAYYLFWVPAADGAKASHRSLPVWYRDRPCRLFVLYALVWCRRTMSPEPISPSAATWLHQLGSGGDSVPQAGGYRRGSHRQRVLPLASQPEAAIESA